MTLANRIAGHNYSPYVSSTANVLEPLGLICPCLCPPPVSFSYVPTAADGELHLQAPEAVVRQVREAEGGGLLRGVL